MSTRQATVTITMGGKPYVLAPTIDHMRVLSRLQGGFLPLFRSVSNLEGDTMALVIAAGADIRGKPVEDLTRAVYEAGLEELVDPLTRFLGICTNGGRDPAMARAKPSGEAGTGKAVSEVDDSLDGDAAGKGDAERGLTPADQEAAA